MVRPPYATVIRLLGIAEEHWAAIDGQAAERGVDYLTLPFDRFCNAIYWWAVQRVKDKDHFDYELAKPIPGLLVGTEVTPEDLDQDAESFMSFAAAMGVTPRRPKSPDEEEPAITSAPAS